MVLPRIAIVAGGVLAVSAALADTPKPSFDCARASTAVEKLICAEPQLAWLDRFMAGVYGRAVASMPAAGKDALKSDQRSWIKDRERDCGTGDREKQVECIAMSYRQQIATLAPLVEDQGADFPVGAWHYFREGLTGKVEIAKAADGTYAIRGDTVASNRAAHNCGIEIDRGQLQSGVMTWINEITECRVTMSFMGDSAIVKYQCAGGSNPDCGVAAAWDGLWVKAPK